MSSWLDHAAAAEAWERQHEAEWSRVDQKLRGIAARRAALDAEEANLLRYAEELKLWRGYGFGSLLEYMERAMGYAPHTAAERLRVARALAELPLTSAALKRGELAHSAVRELSRVAVPDTEEAWLDAARGKNLREIEALVAGHRPSPRPARRPQTAAADRRRRRHVPRPATAAPPPPRPRPPHPPRAVPTQIGSVPGNGNGVPLASS